MKILFLTSSPGYGHTRAAEAIGVALHRDYPQVETRYLDVTELLDPQASAALQDGYLRMTAEYPELYQKLYNLDENFYHQLAGKIPADDELIEFLTEQQKRSYPEEFERTLFKLPVAYKNFDSALLNTLINSICNRPKMPIGRLLSQGLIALIFRVLSARVKKFVTDYDPDCIVATQMYPNALLSRYIKTGALRRPIVGVLTDYGVHGIWVRDTTFLYCVGHQDVADTLRQQGIPAHRIRVTGIPLVPAFEDIPTQQQARDKLQLGNHPTLLITGGQCGIGVANALQQLLEDTNQHYQILVTAGSNACDQEKLQQLACTYPDRIRLFGWQSDMCDLFSATDIVIGKPGGLTLSEALACGKPFIATCCLGGQEQHNVNYLQKNGAGLQIETAEIARVVNELFSNPQQLYEMSKCAQALGKPHAVSHVVKELERLMIFEKVPATNAMPILASGKLS
jgi:UDP-N-acetylglucosamine:LPS N-acetylglucosamine transferase